MLKQSALLLLASLFMGLALSESTLQILFKINPGFIIKKRAGGNHPADLVRASNTLDYELTPDFTGRDVNPQGDFDVAVQINQYGFRDFDRGYDPNAFHIMAIGDSIMYGEGVELEQSFLALVEKRIQETFNPAVQIIKAGVPGYSEKQAVDLLESRYDLFKPEIVILGVTPPESWRNVTGYRNEQGFVVDSRLDKQYFRFEDRLFASNSPNRILAYIETWTEAHFLLPTFIRQRRKFLAEKFSRKGEGIAIPPEESQMSFDELEPIFKQLDRFIDLGKMLGFTPVILLKGYSEADGKTISDYAANKGIPALDLAPLFKVGGGKVLYAFPHDGHWNASTHRLVAEILYNFLVTQKMSPPS
ncbi:MAG: hypothetical protein HY587_08280 [Candidatus Omnitrophica bacterium]|nr:hypothetical protein [Candidatus Omnitrophota bacterium]